MARIRTIKPSFFKSDEVAGLSLQARLLWIGLWTYADDEGRGKDDPRLVKADLFPLDDDVTPAVVEQLLDELSAAERIVRYVVEGKRYLEVCKWTDHQKISHAQESKLPPVPPPEDSGKVPGTLPPEGKGKEGNKEGKGSAARTKAPFPDPFIVTPSMREWASDATPAVDLDWETGEFVDYWRNGEGSGTQRKSWEQTWRSRMRTKQADAVKNGWKPGQLIQFDPGEEYLAR